MAFDNNALLEEIEDQYLAEDNFCPWIVGFSGGKDSTMLLQLVWYTLKRIPQELRKRRVYVVCNNTLVENPKILKYTDGVLEDIEKAAFDQSMPVQVVKTIPKLEDSFWVNLIGKGYPAPNNAFRWCTERLKINPTTEFIKSKVSEDGEAIILLGTRSEESSSRARSMKKHEVDGERLRKHVLPNAYVFAPIKDILVTELWQYLNQVPSPWGSNNKTLNALYRNANGGDCPLVIDDTTPSCGKSRFGCWVCTVVNKDKSMDALIQNGEEWMEPLADLRDTLVEFRNDPTWRQPFRRNGLPGPGPYFVEKRALILETLLQAQKDVNETEPDISLINYQELVAIQVTWYRDNHFGHSVADIYNKVYGTRLSDNDFKDHLIFEKEILKETCAENPDDFQLINELLELQKAKTIMVKARGLQNDLENRLEQFIKEK